MTPDLLNSEINSTRNWLFTTYCSSKVDTPNPDKNQSLKVTEIYLEVLGNEGTKFLNELFNSSIGLKADIQKLAEYIQSGYLPFQNETEHQFLIQLKKTPLKIKRGELRNYVAGALVRKGMINFPEGCIDGGVVRRTQISTAPFADVDISFHLSSKRDGSNVHAQALECVVEYIKSCFQKSANSEFLSPYFSQFIIDLYLRKPFPIYDSEYHQGKGMPMGWVITVPCVDGIDVDLKFIMYAGRYRWNVASRDSFHVKFSVLSENYYLYSVDNAVLCDEKGFKRKFGHLKLNIIVILNKETVSDLFFRLLHDMHQDAVLSHEDAIFSVAQAIEKFCVNNQGNFITRYHHHCRNYGFHSLIFDLLNGLSLFTFHSIDSKMDEVHLNTMVQTIITAFATHPQQKQSAFLKLITKLQSFNDPKSLQSLLELIWGGYLYEAIALKDGSFHFVSTPEFPNITGWRINRSLVAPAFSPYEMAQNFFTVLPMFEILLGREGLSQLLLELNQTHLAKDLHDHRKVAFRLVEGLDRPPFSQLMTSRFNYDSPLAFYDDIERVFPETSPELNSKRTKHAIQQALAETRRLEDVQSEQIVSLIRSHVGAPQNKRLDLISKLHALCNESEWDLRNKPAVQKVISSTLLDLLKVLLANPSGEHLEQMWQLLAMTQIAFDQQQPVTIVLMQLCKQQLQSQDHQILCRLSHLISTYANLENVFISKQDLHALQMEWQARIWVILQDTNSTSISLDCMHALAVVFPKKHSLWQTVLPLVEKAFRNAQRREMRDIGSMMLVLMQNGIRFEGVHSHLLLQVLVQLIPTRSHEVARKLLTTHLKQTEADEKWQSEAQESFLKGMTDALDQPDCDRRKYSQFLTSYLQVSPTISQKQERRLWRVEATLATKENKQAASLFVQTLASFNMYLAVSTYSTLRKRCTTEEQDRLDSKLKTTPILKLINQLLLNIRKNDPQSVKIGLKQLTALLQNKDFRVSIDDKAKMAAAMTALFTALVTMPCQPFLTEMQALLNEAYDKKLISDETWIDILACLYNQGQTKEEKAKIVTKTELMIINRFGSLKSESIYQLLHILLQEKKIDEFRQLWGCTRYNSFLTNSQKEDFCLLMCQIPETLSDVYDFVSSRLKEYPMLGWNLFEILCSSNSMKRMDQVKDLVKRGVLELPIHDKATRLLTLFRFFEGAQNQNTRYSEKLQKVQFLTQQLLDFKEWIEKEGDTKNLKAEQFNAILKILAKVTHEEGSPESYQILCKAYTESAEWLSFEAGNFIFMKLIQFDEKMGNKDLPEETVDLMSLTVLMASTFNHVSITDPNEVKKVLDTFTTSMLRQIKAPSKSYLKELLNLDQAYLGEIFKDFSSADSRIKSLVQKHLIELIAIFVNAEMNEQVATIEQIGKTHSIKECCTAIRTSKSNLLSKYADVLENEKVNDPKALLRMISQSIERLQKYGKAAPVQGRRIVVIILKKAIKCKDNTNVRHNVSDLIFSGLLNNLFLFPKEEFEGLPLREKIKMMEEMANSFNTIAELLYNELDIGEHVPNIGIKMVKMVHQASSTVKYLGVAENMKSAIFISNLLLVDNIINYQKYDNYLSFIEKCFRAGLETMPEWYLPVWSDSLKQVLDYLDEIPAKMQRLDDARKSAIVIRDKGGSNKQMITVIAQKCQDPNANLFHARTEEDKYRQVEKLIYHVLFEIIQSRLISTFVGTEPTRYTFQITTRLLHGTHIREKNIRGKEPNPAYTPHAIIEHLMRVKPSEVNIVVVMEIVKEVMQNFIAYPFLIVRSNIAKDPKVTWKDWIKVENIGSIVAKLLSKDKKLRKMCDADPSLPLIMVVDLLNDLSDEEQTILLSKHSEELMMDQCLKVLKTFTESQHFHQAMIKPETNKKVRAFLACMKQLVEMMCEKEDKERFIANLEVALLPYKTTTRLFENAEHAFTLKKLTSSKLDLPSHYDVEEPEIEV